MMRDRLWNRHNGILNQSTVSWHVCSLNQSSRDMSPPAMPIAGASWCEACNRSETPRKALRRRFLSKTTAFRQFLIRLSPVVFSKRVTLTQSHATYLDTYPNQWLLRTVGFLEHLIQQLCWAGCRNLGSVRTCRPATVYCIYVCVCVYMIYIYMYVHTLFCIVIYCVCVYTHRHNILSNYVYYILLHEFASREV